VTSWKGKTRGGLAGYKIFIGILKYSGLPAAYLLLRFVALYFFLFNPKSFSVIYSFYRTRIGFSKMRAVAAVYRNYYTFGQVLLDRIAVMAGFTAKFNFTFEGEEHLSEMAANTGGILISAHAGNFEMAGFMLERLKAKINIVMYDDEYEKIKELLSSVTRRNFNVIPVRKDDNSHIFAINNALGAKEIVCIHGDRFVEGSKTLVADFLGEGALFPAGPFYLPVQFSVPVSFVFAMKENRNTYHFYATPGRYYGQSDGRHERDRKILSIAKDYTFELEKTIRKYPLQWFNYYDFWEART
jgi:predicted LPLAT superfamily acyltransferase